MNFQAVYHKSSRPGQDVTLQGTFCSLFNDSSGKYVMHFISSKVNPLSNLVCTKGLILDYITINDLVIHTSNCRS